MELRLQFLHSIMFLYDSALSHHFKDLSVYMRMQKSFTLSPF